MAFDPFNTEDVSRLRKSIDSAEKKLTRYRDNRKVLQEALQAGLGDVKDKSVLLLDDIIESGSTLQRAAEVILKGGGGRAVYALVLTRTR